MKKIIIIVSVFIVLNSCNEKSPVNEFVPEDEETEQAAIAQATKHAPQVMECFGYIDVPPSSMAEIHARSSGYISGIAVLEGTQVSKGTLLAEISSPDFALLQRQLQEAGANWSFEQARFARMSGLYEKNALSAADWETAQRDHALAKATFSGLKEQLDAIGFDTSRVLAGQIQTALKLYSPIHGVVTEVHASNGQMATPGDHVFSVIDKSHLHVELQIPASDVQQIELEDQFRFTPAGTLDTLFGEVHLINDVVDEATNTVRVHGHLLDDAHADHLLVGERVFVVFEE